jgi:hypothetical protein
MDLKDHARLYRKNQITMEEINKEHNAAIMRLKRTENLYGAAVVFAFAGPELEFALVEDEKDVAALLEYGDPVGIVSVADESASKFRAFKGHKWANTHADQIIEQAEDCVSITFDGEEEESAKTTKIHVVPAVPVVN